MNKILLPTDFSDNAYRAAEYALLLFQGTNTSFYLLNSYEMPQAGASMLISMEDILKKNSEEELFQLEHALREEYNTPNLQLQTLSIYGDPVYAITKVTDEHSIDMVVMGTKGASGLKEKIIGSNSAHVVKKSSCPVLLVPENTCLQAPSRIVLAIDPSNFNAESLKPLRNLALQTKASVFVLYVAEENEAITEKELIERTGINDSLQGISYVVVIKKSSSAAECIEQYTQEVNANLVVMLPRKTNFFENLFLKSHSKKIAMHTLIPMLALPV